MKRALAAMMLLAAQAQTGMGQVPADAPLPTIEQLRAYLAKRPEQDVIRWKDAARGAPLTVRILEINERGVNLQKTVASGMISRVVPLAELSGLSFSTGDLERRLLRHAGPEAAPLLRVLWRARAASVGVDGSHAADVGLALARVLRMSKESADWDEATAVLDGIESRDDSVPRKEAARNERQTLLLTRALAGGDRTRADQLAWQATERDDNPDAMLMAVAWLADRHFEDLKKLEEHDPRWMEDDEVRPVRQRLYHLSLDFALYTGLFLGTHREEAAEGLRKAWQVHQHTGDQDQALHCLEDLAAWYPETRAARETASELARVQARRSTGVKEEKTGNDAAQESDAEKPEGGAAPSVPPPPKRYNLFDD